jgi:4-amino-4-deoxy-L-arabinose transferase-like glycosyltransferase
MIAWTIWATTAIGGDTEPWVRLASPLFHAVATLAVFAIGRRLYTAETGLAAAAMYALTPAIQLSSAVIATDAPLLMFLGLSLWAYVALQQAEGRRRLWAAAGFGGALGLAFLSKYAALYGVIGLGLHLALSREARRAWTPAAAGIALAALLLVLAPNLAWNATHGFATLQHTAANAAWGGRKLFNPQELGEFVLSQFGSFGPIPFAILAGGSAVLAWRRKLTAADVLLLCFTLPPLLIVMGQAFISRANANWSGAGYLPGAILVAAWLMRWRARGWLIGTLAFQAAVAAIFLVFVLAPGAAEAVGAANSFKRAKGWDQTTRQVIQRARAEGDAGLSAVAVNNRGLFNAMSYYGRDFFGAPGAPPLTVWLLEAHAQNQAEATHPLTPALGARVLAVSLEQAYRKEMAADFRAVSGVEIVSVSLDRKRRRRAELFIGEGFAPRPRIVSGRSPTPP